MVPLAYMFLMLVFIHQHLTSKFESWLFHLFTIIHSVSVCFILATFAHAALTVADEVVQLTIFVFGVYQGKKEENDALPVHVNVNLVR